MLFAEEVLAALVGVPSSELSLHEVLLLVLKLVLACALVRQPQAGNVGPLALLSALEL